MWGVLATTLIVLASVPSSAEVAVSNTSDSNDPTVYVLSSITDNPDPLGIAWKPYSGDNTNRVILNAAGYENGDGPPSVGVNRLTDEIVVAWARNSTSGYDVVVSRFSAGTWSGAEIVAGSPDDELDPQLVVDPKNGHLHVVYWVAGAESRVMVRTALDGVLWADPVQVSRSDEAAMRPSAVLRGEALFVAYEAHASGVEGSPKTIVVASRVNGVFLGEVAAVTPFDGPSWPGIHAAGSRLWIEWIDGIGEMVWTWKDDETSWQPIESERFADTEERDYRVRQTIKAKVRKITEP